MSTEDDLSSRTPAMGVAVAVPPPPPASPPRESFAPDDADAWASGDSGRAGAPPPARDDARSTAESPRPAAALASHGDPWAADDITRPVDTPANTGAWSSGDADRPASVRHDPWSSGDAAPSAGTPTARNDGWASGDADRAAETPPARNDPWGADSSRLAGAPPARNDPWGADSSRLAGAPPARIDPWATGDAGRLVDAPLARIDPWATGEATRPIAPTVRDDPWSTDDATRPVDTPPTRNTQPYLEGAAPIALDGFTAGIEPLDGLIVVSLSDGSIYGAWVRQDAGFSAEDVAPSLREAYRSAIQSARKIAILSSAAAGRALAMEPFVTIETVAQTALLKRVRAFVVACLFDASLPLGMARLCAARLAASLEPELPLADLTRLTLPPPMAGGSRGSRPPPSLRLTMPRKAPHASSAEVEHVRKVIAYAESLLPDPHTVRLRLSLRSHTPRLALDHPETMASDAVLRIETAVVEMLGIDREQLALALLGSGS